MTVGQRFKFVKRATVFLHWASPVTDLILLIVYLLFSLHYLSSDILRSTPATGGDTGSHYWTLVQLVQDGLPNGTLRLWNPGNQLGEPRLIHYFPFPFLVMALLSTFMPLGMAFNLGSILPVILLPAAVYTCLKLLRLQFPIPILATFFTLLFIYNESYSMWGGNTLSTLAGQFAHGYGLLFLILGIGFLGWELRKGKKIILSGVFFCFSILSHAYAALSIPVFMFAFMLLIKQRSLFDRVKACFLSGSFAFGLSLWFLIPMVDNQKWMTKFVMSWTFNSYTEVLAPNFYPALIVLFCAILYLFITTIRKKSSLSKRQLLSSIQLWGIPILFYVLLFLLLPLVGLINIRALPQIFLFSCILSGIFCGIFILSFGRLTAWMLTIPLALAITWWTDLNVKNYPNWVKWNYSGWTTKHPYPDLQRLTSLLKGTFSDPRVLFELSAINDATGSIRVFEMLPYFSNRATVESLYLEATILAPQTAYLQAEVSKFPSCPLQQFSCPHYNIENAQDRLKLMGVNQLILNTDEVVKEAQNSSFLFEQANINPWHLFKAKDPISLVETLKLPPQPVSFPVWRESFYKWFENYDKSKPFLITEVESKLPQSGQDKQLIDSTQACQPNITVGLKKITLKTDCPGKWHYLKFAFNSAWQADNNDPIYLISPGFIGIVPSEKEVVLRFAAKRLWLLGDFISPLVFVILLIYSFAVPRKKIRPSLN